MVVEELYVLKIVLTQLYLLRDTYLTSIFVFFLYICFFFNVEWQPVDYGITANMTCGHNVRRWASNKPALVQRLVCVG